MPNPDRIAALIVKGYTEPLAEEEKTELANWAAQSEQNRLLLERLNNRKIIKANLQQYYAMMQEVERGTRTRPVAYARTWRVVAVLGAAAILAALVFGLVRVYPGKWRSKPVLAGRIKNAITDNEHIDSVELPDHTRIWLNTSSYIHYPDTFATGSREVVLSGEAYFEVSKDRTKPFLVKVVLPHDTVLVAVTGTHFNILTGAAGQQVVTTVLQGSVQITKGAKTAALHAGQQVIADKDGLSAPLTVDTSITMAWKNNAFECRNVPISQIMNQLKGWYGKEVAYYGSVGDHFSGVFEKNKGLTGNLALMEATRRVRFIVSADTIGVKNLPAPSNSPEGEGKYQ